MNSLSEQDFVHVVIGIILNTEQEALVSRRKSDVHLGGLLEFPGGKIKTNETPKDALKRELKEELDIYIQTVRPLIKIPYHYKDRKILLDAYLVDEYSGSIYAKEKQEMSWRSIATLHDEDFPAANFGVLRALKLPKVFPVTPNYSDESNFLASFEKIVSRKSIKIIQLRSHELDSVDFIKLAKKCISICDHYNVKLVLNKGKEVLDQLDVYGMHLTSKRLLNTKKRPLKKEQLVGASCHNEEEIMHANDLRLDYIFIGPVIEKNSSGKIKVLEWRGFAELSLLSQIPVYAIGGLKIQDIDKSFQMGGQGIATIRDTWLN